jgi:steroid delta-isomerase-like uncharacterized protein
MTIEITRARMITVEDHVRSETAHDLQAIMRTFGPHARYDDEAGDEHHEGLSAVRSFYEAQFRAAPDLHVDVKRRHVTEENIILEVEISGTHRGRFRGLPGTGSQFRFTLCAVYSFNEENKLAGERIYYDRATVYRQLGLFHEPTTLFGRIMTPLLHPLTMARAIGRMLLAR